RRHAIADLDIAASTLVYVSGHILFFNQTPAPQIYTLSLHDALPIFWRPLKRLIPRFTDQRLTLFQISSASSLWSSICHVSTMRRSEEHTSELQSRFDLVCRLLLEKKNEKHATSSQKCTRETVATRQH